MNLRVFVLPVIILVGSMALRNYPLEVKVPAPSTEIEAAVLASTVQIAMYEHAPAAGESEPGSRGLGTLVAIGEESLIVTHDHWAHFTPNLHEVELHDAQGQLLLTLDAQTFRALIRYRDRGTMLLQAPDRLHNVVAATLGPPAGAGEHVWFTRRDPASGRMTVEVVAATVMALERAAPPARMHLRNEDDSGVIPGDSGGGVWANGRLVANVWAAGFEEERAFCCNWFGGGEEASDLVIAALPPLGGQSGAAAQIQANSGAEHLEVGAQQAESGLTKQEQLQATLLAD